MKNEAEEKIVEPAAEDGKTKELSETDLYAVAGVAGGGSETEPGQGWLKENARSAGGLSQDKSPAALARTIFMYLPVQTQTAVISILSHVIL